MVPAESVPITVAVTVPLAFTWVSVLLAGKVKVVPHAGEVVEFDSVPPTTLFQVTPVIVPPKADKDKAEVDPGS